MLVRTDREGEPMRKKLSLALVIALTLVLSVPSSVWADALVPNDVHAWTEHHHMANDRRFVLRAPDVQVHGGAAYGDVGDGSRRLSLYS